MTAILTVLFLSSPAADRVTYEALLGSMTDLRALAIRPEDGEFCRQASSYNRKTRWDPEKKAIAGNEANADHGMFIRKEGPHHVMAELEGPGSIMRIWSANAAGVLVIWIDGSAEPTLSVEMAKLLGGKVEPLTEPIAGVRSRGWNLYLPIPYAKSCKVAVRDIPKPESLYYQVTYRTFPKGTDVESFRWPLPDAWKAGIEKVKATLLAPGSDYDKKSLQEFPGTFSIQPGEGPPLTLQGPSAIAGVEMNFENLPSDPKERREALRKVLVTARFDDEENAILCPLGDLFGTAPGLNPYPGYPIGITKEGKAYSHWYMPFKKQAIFKVKNFGDRTLSGTSRMRLEPLSIPQEKVMYFHADWRFESPVTSAFDWPLLVSKGRGRFCGVALHVFNQRTGWWGEGDEKMWIDGEDFPSTIGTGSEDYFGYAWCNAEPFFNAYHNQPLCEGPKNGNYTSVNRFQIPDNVPFHDTARITIEAYNRGTVTYAATTYWYGAAGTTTDAKPVDLGAIKWPEPVKHFELLGAIEAEGLKVLRKDPDFPVGRQDISGHGQFSNGNQIWLRPKAAGATVEFAIPAKVKPGKYRLTLWAVKSWNYGIVEWSLNGKPVAPPIDGYSAKVVAQKIDGGVVEIREGENRLSVKVTGKAEKSTGFYAGLDALKLEPVEGI